MSRIEIAMARIRDILEDDENYQTDTLKLGGIWACCEYAATYRRYIDTNINDSIEVIERVQTGLNSDE